MERGHHIPEREVVAEDRDAADQGATSGPSRTTGRALVGSGDQKQPRQEVNLHGADLGAARARLGGSATADATADGWRVR